MTATAARELLLDHIDGNRTQNSKGGDKKGTANLEEAAESAKSESDTEISEGRSQSIIDEEQDAAPVPNGQSKPGRSDIAQILDLSDKERKYITDLAPAIVWSPRRITRFVNTYKILKASLHPDTRAALTAKDYRGVLTLLAAATGGTQDLVHIRRWFEEHAEGSIADLIAEVDRRSSSALIENAKSPFAKCSELKECLRVIERQSGGDDDVKSMRKHISLCLRYSFDMP
jgi:hypothetical protein